MGEHSSSPGQEVAWPVALHQLFRGGGMDKREWLGASGVMEERDM